MREALLADQGVFAAGAAFSTTKTVFFT